MAKKKERFFVKYLLVIIVTLIISVITTAFVMLSVTNPINDESEPKQTFAKSNLDTTTWNTHTQGAGKFTIQYPSTWVIEEKHIVSNEEVNDQSEINAIILKGKEGQITLSWGVMGFGGGCDEKYHTQLQLKDEILKDICSGIDDSTGKWFWSQIYPSGYGPALGVHAEANSGSMHDAEVIKKIFSTLTN